MLTKLNVNNGREQDSPGEALCSSVESQGQPQASGLQDGPYPTGAPHPPRSAVGRKGGPGTHTQPRAVLPPTGPPAPRNPDTDQSLFSILGSPPPPGQEQATLKQGISLGAPRFRVSPQLSTASLRLMPAGHRPSTPRVVRSPLWD